MKFYKWNKHYLGWGITAFIVIVASMLVLTMLTNIGNIASGIGGFISAVSPILYGLIIAYLLAPVVEAFEKRAFRKLFTGSDAPPPAPAKRSPSGSRQKKSPVQPQEQPENNEKFAHLRPYVKNKPRRILSITVTFLIVLGIIIGMLVAIVPQLASTIKLLVDNIPTYIRNTTDWINGIFENYPEIGKELTSIINDAGSTLRNFLNTSILPQMGDYLGFLTNGIMSLVGLIMNLIFGMVVAIYCLYSKELFSAQLKKILYSSLSVRHANGIITSVRRIHHSFGNFITGTIIDSFVVGCITFIVTTIAGVPFSLLVSVIMGLTNIIPYFGPFIGLVPSLFLIFMEEPVMCIVFTVIVLIIQNVNGNIISPRILGESTGLTSFWVIFAILVGQGIFGFWGLIIGIPLFAVIYSAVKTFVADKLRSRGLPPGSDAYTDIDVFNEEDLVPVSLSDTLAAEQAEKNRREAEETAERRRKRAQTKQKLTAAADSIKRKLSGSGRK